MAKWNKGRLIGSRSLKSVEPLAIEFLRSAKLESIGYTLKVPEARYIS
jgi:hypothetical protein